MILLTATTDKLQVVTDSTAAVDVHVSYMRYGTVTDLQRQNTAINSAATTDVLGGPVALTQRNVKIIHIRNKDASLAVNATVQFNENGSTFELHQAQVRPGDTLSYVDGVGFFLLPAHAGRITGTVTADVNAKDGNGIVNPWFSGIQLTVPANTTYRLTGLLTVSAINETQHNFSLSFGGTATLTSLDYYVQVIDTNNADARGTFKGVHVSNASTIVVSEFTWFAAYITIDGILRTNAAGTLIPQFTEASGTAPITVKRNIYFRLEPLGAGAFESQGTWS